jgi:hypothetical protein
VTVAQALALETAKLKISVPAGFKVTLSDSPMNVAAQLTAGTTSTISKLASTGVGALNVSGNLTLTVAQIQAFEAAKLGITLLPGDYTLVSDSAAQIKSLSTTQIAGLGALDVKTLSANDTSVTLTVAQAEALLNANVGVSVPMNQNVIIYDSAANLQTMLGTLNSTQLQSLKTMVGVSVLEASNNVSYTIAQTSALLSAGFNIMEVGSNTVTENSNGNYSVYQHNNMLVQQKTVNTDGTYDLAYYHLTGAYSSYEDLYSSAGVKLAEMRDNTDTTGGITLYGNNLTVTQASSGESVTMPAGPDTFTDGIGHAAETVMASGRANETFIFGPNFGQDTITGFVAAHDFIQFEASMFNYLTPNMSQALDVAAVLNPLNKSVSTSGGNTTIRDSAGDSLTLNSVTVATLAGNPSAFKFV